jgi:glutaredoxin
MKSLIFFPLFVFSFALQAAQYYEWVDEKGIKQFTQHPPPANIKKVQERQVNTSVVGTSTASYGMQQAVKKFPVTLYVTDCGAICKDARAHLEKRGVPFAEKNPQKAEDFELFKKATGGGMEVPVLVVGELKTVKGYSQAEWDSALDAAGYPSTAVPGAKPSTAPPAPAK